MTAIISFSVQDDDGDVQSVPVYVDDTGLDLDDLKGFAADFGDLLKAAIDGVITSASITVDVVPEAGWALGMVANCEVQKGALLSFGLEGTKYTYSLRIPTLAPGLFVDNAVDTEDPLVDAIIDALVDGLTPVATLVPPCNKFGIDLISSRGGVKSFHK